MASYAEGVDPGEKGGSAWEIGSGNRELFLRVQEVGEKEISNNIPWYFAIEKVPRSGTQQKEILTGIKLEVQ